MSKLDATSSLDEWLLFIESQHTKVIELGLERVAQVAASMQLSFPHSKVITVAGTNGKGTTCACIEQLCLAHGLSTAVYSSPHLVDYTERVRVNAKQLTEQQHCNAFTAVEAARGDVQLTYFEYGTLGALWLAQQATVDVVILEVGLGGRLDAVNIIDPDIAVITRIGIDHQQWLGDNRDDIGREKAGILRPAIPFICGDAQVPNSIVEIAKKLKCDSSYIGTDFHYQTKNQTKNQTTSQGWSWQSSQHNFKHLALPRCPLENAATALKAFEKIGVELVASQINVAMQRSALPGRFQVINQQPLVILDVAHNPQACALLNENLNKLSQFGRMYAVVGMLEDKDIVGSLAELSNRFDHWYLASISEARGATANKLADSLQSNQSMTLFDSIQLAYDTALNDASADDVIVVFGSFITVAEILKRG